MTTLQDALVLHRFICREFGYDGMSAMLDRLRDVPPTCTASGESEYAQAIYLHPERTRISLETLAKYDANITAHSRHLRMTVERGRGWKPHQYLALLFTEHYLCRYFGNIDELCADLNEAKNRNPRTRNMPDYAATDLHTVALQSATGSGKTLIMHASILQYQHWLSQTGQQLNNIILVTPNEHMSRQHDRDLRESGISARLFSNEAGSDLLAPVEIIDLNKLAEKRGIKRVAVRDFGENNLVLVDEGHLGASGRVWRERREELARGGFTFEYSATFNQITGNDSALRNAYGKCLLFDYSYREFYEDGYGKDYSISNLPGGAEDENSHMYLLGCLLIFYQQCLIWRTKNATWKAFNLTKPLWVFLGKTVIGTSKADKETRSDVIRILSFLGWFMANKEDVGLMLKRLLENESGLIDEMGNDFFAGRFYRLSHNHPDNLYTDICETLFYGQGQLHVVYLTRGGGELHLRSASNKPFGVINVGDSTALYNALTGAADPNVHVERDLGFGKALFAGVDREDSTINIVIGARRFIAGWNSWRVSTMGLMHVGVQEGPEIIQMFGRGIRLKGWNMSLKRHQESGVEPPEDSEDLTELETLYIFGLRANYMQTFRDLLRKEEIPIEQIAIPVTWNFAKETDLKFIRIRGNQKYASSKVRPVLLPPQPSDPIVKMDLYSRLQAVASGGAMMGGEIERVKFEFAPHHIDFFDKIRIYDSLLVRKLKMGWHNLIIPLDTVKQLLSDTTWYELYAPPEKTDVQRFDNVRALENVFIDLLAEYASQFWRRQRRKWEHEKIDVVTLNENDPNNIGEYRLSLSTKEEKLINDLHELQKDIDYQLPRDLKLTIIQSKAHAYEPLLHAKRGCTVTVQPVPLNDGEKKVVQTLDSLARHDDDCLQGKELFLIRNLTRGRGVSFFDDCGYYPDFILWLKDEHEQHVVFLDPKGLSYYGPEMQKKIGLHTGIKDIEKRIHEREPNLHLHAYVLSVTPLERIGSPREQEEWEGKGVYFLENSDCLQRMITHVLEPTP